MLKSVPALENNQDLDKNMARKESWNYCWSELHSWSAPQSHISQSHAISVKPLQRRLPHNPSRFHAIERVVLLLEPMHLNILAGAEVPRVAFQRVVVLQPMGGRYAPVGAAEVEEYVRLDGVDVCDRGRLEYPLRHRGGHARWEGLGAFCARRISLRQRVDWILDIPLVEILDVNRLVRRRKRAGKVIDIVPSREYPTT